MAYTILVADDERSNLQLILNYLEEADQDYAVISAPNGMVACKLATEKKPDIILMDWIMPGMSGIEAVEYLKKQEETKDIPIVMVTAQTSSEELKKGLETGAMDYIKKPVDKVELLARVRSAIELYESYNKIKAQQIEIAKAKEQIEKYAAELEDRNQELREFTSIASHDLKEPLRKVITYSSRLKDILGQTEDEKVTDYLEKLVETGARMQSLIEDLLKYSTVSIKKEPFEDTDLEKVLKDVVSDLEVRIKESGAQVEVDDNLPKIKADQTQMRQLFQNLISNALKFQNKGNVPKVSVNSQIVNKEFIEIKVNDNGVGFDEKYLDRIFKPFQRLHSPKDYEGTGIGTAICYKIVSRHGGEITATSTPGEGSSFIIRIPVKNNGETQE
ncbi:MAG: hybrid sensor histidine kinase/response regulator [Bacteroidetes bacterium]|nr:response regulator [Bacteroidia bacterium]PCH68035.1 MAG: hybrid sensor histidine kinase/response regulator [Bacteroidota bacterium]